MFITMLMGLAQGLGVTKNFMTISFNIYMWYVFSPVIDIDEVPVYVSSPIL